MEPGSERMRIPSGHDGGLIDHGRIGGRSGGPAHELAVFIDEVSETLTAEYARIRRRVLEDPGTAGDEAELNWRGALADWLPNELTVVTKGRILGHHGELSPQLDIIVLRPGYPPFLRDKKTYLAGGVLAAFEGKLTLRPPHIKEAAKTARVVRRLASARNGLPYNELNSPIIFGLLAHDTTVKREPLRTLDQALGAALADDTHPRDALDVLCVASLATWTSTSLVIPRWPDLPDAAWEVFRQQRGLDREGGVQNFYMRWTDTQKADTPPPRPLYLLFEHLMVRIAWEVDLYRPLAEYWLQSRRGGARSIAGRSWPLSVLTPDAAKGVAEGKNLPGPIWNPWRTS
jgi:hypothetical protein